MSKTLATKFEKISMRNNYIINTSVFWNNLISAGCKVVFLENTNELVHLSPLKDRKNISICKHTNYVKLSNYSL